MLISDSIPKNTSVADRTTVIVQLHLSMFLELNCGLFILPQ